MPSSATEKPAFATPGTLLAQAAPGSHDNLSEIAEQHVEFDVVVTMPRPMIAVGTGEADVQRVLVGADLWNVGIVQLERNADHLRTAATKHQLEGAAGSHVVLGSTTAPQQAQHDGQRITQRQHGLQPASRASRRMPGA
jgi:hypothetical protein